MQAIYIMCLLRGIKHIIEIMALIIVFVNDFV